MINFKNLALFILLLLSISNAVFSEELYCIDDSFTGNFDIEKKPGMQNCNNLNGSYVSYNTCLQKVKRDTESYSKGLTAFRKGNCYQYKTVSNHYGSASCSAQYVLNKKGYNLQKYSKKGNDADSKVCIEQIENKIKQKHKALQNMR